MFAPTEYDCSDSFALSTDLKNTSISSQVFIFSDNIHKDIYN